jgi:hypothetical protein
VKCQPALAALAALFLLCASDAGACDARYTRVPVNIAVGDGLTCSVASVHEFLNGLNVYNPPRSLEAV